MNINIDKEKLARFGKTAMKVGKHIVIEGTIAVTAKGAANVLRVGLEDGFDTVKQMDVDGFLGVDGEKDSKKVKKKEKRRKVTKEETQSDDIIERRKKEKVVDLKPQVNSTDE